MSQIACPQILNEFWRRWRRKSRQIAWLFLATGLLAFSWQRFQIHLLSWQISQALDSAEYSQELDQSQFFPTHLKMGDYVDSKVVLGYYQDGNWTNNLQHATYLFGSGVPQSPGKTIIYGHNTDQIMGRLPQTKVGDTLKLTLANGQTRQYQVDQSYRVNLSDINVLQQTENETLLLYTCYGWLDSQRWVVLATPINASSLQ